MSSVATHPQTPTWMTTMWGKAVVIFMYLSGNISLNMANKWMISMYGFRFPLLLSIAHQTFTFAALAPLMLTKQHRDTHQGTLEKQWIGLLAVGMFFAANVGFNNVSLSSISLSLNQVIRSAIPVVTAVAAVLLENRRPTRMEFVSLVALTSGISIAVWEGSTQRSSALGALLCILGTICNGMMMSLSGRLMSERVDVLRLTFYTSPTVVISLLPFFQQLEADDFAEYRANAPSSTYLVLLLGTCFLALGYNLIHYQMIKITSSVTTTVLGEMKIVLILGLSSVVLKESSMWTLKMLFGCSLAILGFCLYSHTKLKQAGAAAQKTPEILGVPELGPRLIEKASLLPKTVSLGSLRTNSGSSVGGHSSLG